MAQVIARKGYRVVTSDIDTGKEADFHLDAREPEVYAKAHANWVVTNPPFNQAMEILKMAHDKAKGGVAMLLRLSFLEPTFERQDFLSANPPNKLIVLPRISFTGDGKTDSVTCAWMVWQPSLLKGTVEVVKK